MPTKIQTNVIIITSRILKENRIYAGLWYGSAKPDMTLFLKPLSLTLKKLYHEG